MGNCCKSPDKTDEEQLEYWNQNHLKCITHSDCVPGPTSKDFTDYTNLQMAIKNKEQKRQVESKYESAPSIAEEINDNAHHTLATVHGLMNQFASDSNCGCCYSKLINNKCMQCIFQECSCSKLAEDFDKKAH